MPRNECGFHWSTIMWHKWPLTGKSTVILVSWLRSEMPRSVPASLRSAGPTRDLFWRLRRCRAGADFPPRLFLPCFHEDLCSGVQEGSGDGWDGVVVARVLAGRWGLRWRERTGLVVLVGQKARMLSRQLWLKQIWQLASPVPGRVYFFSLGFSLSRHRRPWWGGVGRPLGSYRGQALPGINRRHQFASTSSWHPFLLGVKWIKMNLLVLSHKIILGKVNGNAKSSV